MTRCTHPNQSGTFAGGWECDDCGADLPMPSFVRRVAAFDALRAMDRLDAIPALTRFDYAAWNSADPSVRARVRGRAITDRLYDALAHPNRLHPFMVQRIERGDPQAWAAHIDPSGGWGER